MRSEDLEFAISQYLDGTLQPLETAALEERLATDPHARALLEEYRQLDSALKTSLRVPAIEWDRLSTHLAQVVWREQPPVRHYSLLAWRRAAGVALAACLSVVFAVAFLSYRTGSEFVEQTLRPRQDTYAMVSGPQAQSAAQAAPVTQIAVGPAPSMSESWRYAESVISRPAIVMIDRGSSPGQDMDSFW